MQHTNTVLKQVMAQETKKDLQTPPPPQRRRRCRLEPTLSNAAFRFCLRFDCGLMPKILSTVVAVAKTVSAARDFALDSITKCDDALLAKFLGPCASTPVMFFLRR